MFLRRRPTHDHMREPKHVYRQAQSIESLMFQPHLLSMQASPHSGAGRGSKIEQQMDLRGGRARASGPWRILVVSHVYLDLIAPQGVLHTRFMRRLVVMAAGRRTCD